MDIGPISSAAAIITGLNQPSNASSNMNTINNQQLNGQTALTQIHESTINIERAENSRIIKESLAETIRLHGRKEKILRQSTISFNNKDINTREISDLIDSEWVFKMNQAPVTYWNDKEFIHCQFIDNEAKLLFASSGIPGMPKLNGRMTPMNDYGEHFKRRPVRMIINNVRAAIRTERIVEIIRNCTDFDTDITEVKDGKPHPVTKNRSIFFKLNGHGLRVLIEKTDAEIPYADKSNPAKARLRAKINCKPWQCKDCGAIGLHNCEGKKCRNCSMNGHETKNCPSSTRFCGNCKKRGHRSTDIHCQTFLNEVAKEIRKMDIPIEMFEDKNLRLSLAKAIQLK